MSDSVISMDEEDFDNLKCLTLQDIARLAARYGLALVPEEPTGLMCRASGLWAVEAKAAYLAMIATGRVK